MLATASLLPQVGQALVEPVVVGEQLATPDVGGGLDLALQGGEPAGPVVSQLTAGAGVGPHPPGQSGGEADDQGIVGGDEPLVRAGIALPAGPAHQLPVDAA